MADMHMPLTLADLEYDCSGAQRDFFLQTIAADTNITTPADMSLLRAALEEAL